MKIKVTVDGGETRELSSLDEFKRTFCGSACDIKSNNIIVIRWSGGSLGTRETRRLLKTMNIRWFLGKTASGEKGDFFDKEIEYDLIIPMRVGFGDERSRNATLLRLMEKVKSLVGDRTEVGRPPFGLYDRVYYYKGAKQASPVSEEDFSKNQYMKLPLKNETHEFFDHGGSEETVRDDLILAAQDCYDKFRPLSEAIKLASESKKIFLSGGNVGAVVKGVYRGTLRGGAPKSVPSNRTSKKRLALIRNRLAHFRQQKDAPTFLDPTCKFPVKIYEKRLYAVLARMTHGKTTLSVNVAINFIRDSNKRVLMISNEETEDEVYSRLAFNLLKIDWKKYPEILEQEKTFEEVNGAIELLEKQINVIGKHDNAVDTCALESVVNCIKAANEEYGLIVLDHVQGIVRSCAVKEPYEISKKLTEFLNDFRSESGIPIIVFAQLHSDGVEVQNDRAFQNNFDTVISMRTNHPAQESILTLVKYRKDGSLKDTQYRLTISNGRYFAKK